MKKLIAILCAVLILCSFAACSVTCNQFVNDGVDFIKANAADSTAGFTPVFYGDIIHGIASLM